MQKKKWLIWSSLLGLGGAGAAVFAGRAVHRQKQEDKKKSQIIAEVRAYFNSFDPISVVYVNDFESTDQTMTGGVVFDDGVTFTFRYHDGEIDYKEEDEND